MANWNIDRTINLPFILGVAGQLALSIWWLSNLQFQVNQNSNEIAAWKLTWQQFTQARELTVRNYEQRMTTQEQLGREIMRRLDSIDANLQRLNTPHR